MTTKATLQMNLVTLNETELNPPFPPDGAYPGKWTGRNAVFQYSIYEYTIDTEDGVRGINCACTVHIKDRQITVE